MKEQVNKLLNNKKIKGKETMIVLMLIGAVIAIMVIPTKEKEEKIITRTESDMEMGVEYKGENYEEELEERLEEILSQMEGVGKVQVMITLQSSAKEVVEKDYSTQENRENVSLDETNQSSISKEENTVYSETDEGSVPYVVQEIYPKVEGVLVVAEGGDNSYVNIAIVEAIQALFDVDIHKIKIVKMNIN